MYISQATIKNFRLLKNMTIDFQKDLSLLLGKNNSGKTSFLMLFENFLSGNQNFTYDDFPLSIRESILDMDSTTSIYENSIQLLLEITYEKEDNLEHISDFITDLDEDENTVYLLFECTIQRDRLLKDLNKIDINKREKFIVKMLSKYLQTDIYVCEKLTDLSEGRSKLPKKDLSDIRKIINFQVIHAKRNVASSEGESKSKRALSELTTRYYNDWFAGDDSDNLFSNINEGLIDMDEQLEVQYEVAFEGFLKEASNFLGGEESLRVISNLESESLLQHSSQVIYGSKGGDSLPENLNGLGYMNILYLLLNLEIHKKRFENEKKNINLLFIEEPEAHTHPQLQYVFARKIKEFLSKGVPIQTFITTHSSHMVSEWDFEAIRYFQLIEDGGYKKVEAKNFVKSLEYYFEKNDERFKFLNQYLTLFASELFFAEKIIFIEGTTERMLLPYFIKRIDSVDEVLTSSEPDSIDRKVPLSSQNITVLEVGANAKVFEPFINFFEIKTLIITDLDTIDTKKERSKVSALKGDSTSNETLKHFFCFDGDNEEWIKGLKSHDLDEIECKRLSPYIKISYQIGEDGHEKNYQGRSFEDAFININFEEIKGRVMNNEISGMQHKKLFTSEVENIYDFSDKVVKGKTEFASSLLYLALAKKEVDWKIPLYIQEGLRWLKK